MSIQLGIKENRNHFILLVLLNLFVGAMVGLERTIMPLLGEEEFGVKSTVAVLSFIVSFGFSKAIVNYFAGMLADKFGRKRILMTGWGVGLLVPILILIADGWWVIILANVLLGINQGLAWSMTVNMKIDLAKSTERGTAVGLNEFAGYSGVALLALVSGYIATTYSVRPEPFYLGLAIAIIGFILSFGVKDTAEHLAMHMKNSPPVKAQMGAAEVFKRTTWKDNNLSGFTFAGLATNFKDGMAWGLFPIFFLTAGLSLQEIGWLVAVYPAAWGFFQLFTGTLSDKFGRKYLLVSGMLLQAASLWFILSVEGIILWMAGAILLGIGTALVYPVLQAAIGDVATPDWRASAMGVYRFWRDSGYAFGALFAGLLADSISVPWAIGLVALLPSLAALNLIFLTNETHP